MGLQFLVAIHGYLTLTFTMMVILDRLLTPLSTAWWRKDTSQHKIYLSTFLVALLGSTACFSSIPLDDTVPCDIYITKAAEPFGYINLYCMMLPVTIYTLYVNSNIFHIARKHLKQIDVQTSDNTESSVKANRKLVFYYLYNCVWTFVSWFIIFVIIQTHFISRDLVSNRVIHILFILLYLGSSVIPAFYMIFNGTLKKHVKQKLLLYDRVRNLFPVGN